MDDIAAQLAIRDRFRRNLAMRETPAQRLAAMFQLQESTWNLLKSSPQGWDRFIRRNFKRRAIPWKKEYVE
jgi:hypothetical protein